MGGFVIDVSDMHPTMRYLTLTPEGVLKLARRGHFLRVYEWSIKDKSKADVLAKGLVCVQVFWLVVQCIARKASGYPISLLELHTFVHVICALMMYGLWFRVSLLQFKFSTRCANFAQKPLDVNEPTIVDTTAFQHSLAVGLTWETEYRDCSFTNKSGPIKLAAPTARHLEGWLIRFKSEELLCPEESEVESENPDGSSTARNPLDENTIHIQYPGKEDVVKTLRTGQTLSNGIGPGYLYRSNARDGSQPTYWIRGLRPSSESLTVCPLRIDLTEKSIRRWERAGIARIKREELDTYINDSARSLFPWNKSDPDKWDFHRDSWMRSLNFPYKKPGSFNPFSSSELLNQWILATVLLALLFAYGGLHITAWNFQFPSSQEQILWRIASLNLIGTGALGTILFFIWNRDGNHDSLDPPRQATIAQGGPIRKCAEQTAKFFYRAVLLLSILLLIVLGIAYLVSRIYIVLESFICIRHLPIGVYAVNPWTSYIPHL